MSFSAFAFDDSYDKGLVRTDAQIEFQNKMAKLLLAEAPRELEQLIFLQRDLQVTSYKLKRLRLVYLVKVDPQRDGVGRGMNFDWSDEDEASLLAESKDYRNLTEYKAELKQKNQNHPKWPELRQIVGKVTQTEEYKRIHHDLMVHLRQK